MHAQVQKLPIKWQQGEYSCLIFSTFLDGEDDLPPLDGTEVVSFQLLPVSEY